MKTYSFKKTYLFNIGTFVLLALLFTTVNAQEYKVRMAMMGNSITYGAQLASPSTESYPAQLSDMLSEIYGDTCEVMNYGVSASTMMRSAEVPLWNEAAFTNTLEYVPDIC